MAHQIDIRWEGVAGEGGGYRDESGQGREGGREAGQQGSREAVEGGQAS